MKTSVRTRRLRSEKLFSVRQKFVEELLSAHPLNFSSLDLSAKGSAS